MLMMFLKEIQFFIFTALKSKCKYMGIWVLGSSPLQTLQSQVFFEGNVLKFTRIISSEVLS